MTTRTRETRPQPTVRPPRSRAAARLGRGAVLPFIVGVFGAVIGVVLHRYALAAAVLGIGLAVAAPILAASAVVQARLMRLNPWPFVLGAELLAALAAWRVLPVIGLGLGRYPMLIGTIWLAGRAIRRWIRYQRRSAVYHRWAQALSPVVSQSSGQQEQVLAGLAGTTSAERVTAPHYGSAPNAAWSLTIARWDGDQVARFTLRLPAHDDITIPELLIKIKDAHMQEKRQSHNAGVSRDLQDPHSITTTGARQGCQAVGTGKKTARTSRSPASHERAFQDPERGC